MPRRRETAALAADRAALRAIEELYDYEPSNQAYSTPMLQRMEAAMLEAEEEEERARLDYERALRAYTQTRSVRAEATSDFRRLMRGAKTHVLAHYGEDSYAVQAIGWTRKSDRRRPGRRPTAK
jgi:hypothetical protein